MGKRTVNIIYCIAFVLCVSFLLGAGQNKDLEEVTVVHVVKSGETLQGISEQYMPRGGYLLEFAEGIYELNYNKVFASREQGGAPKKSIYTGDELEVHYWR